MGEIAKVEVRFRLIGSDLDPIEVTRVLGIEPSLARARGTVDSRTGRTQPVGIWLLGSDELSDSTDEQRLDFLLQSLLDRLEPRAEALLGLVRRGYQADFYCSWYMQTENEGTRVPPLTLKRVAALEASLDMSVWVPAGSMAD